MTILWVGGEQNEFGMISANISTGAGNFDPAYARCAIHPTADVGARHLYDGRLRAYLDAQTEGDREFWKGYRWRGGGGSLNVTGAMITFYGPAGPFFKIANPFTSNMLQAYTSLNGGATWDPYPLSMIVQGGAPVEHTFRLWSHPTVGRIEWWVGESLWWFFQGNTYAMTTDFTEDVLGNPNSNVDSYFSEGIASSRDHARVGMRLRTLVPDSDSAAHSDWSGGYVDIDEIIENAIDSIFTSTPGAIELFGLTDLPALGPGVVPLGLVISSKLQTVGGAPQNAQGAIRIAGTDYFTPSQAISTAPENRQFFFDNDPSQPPGTKLSAAVINAIEAGLKAVA